MKYNEDSRVKIPALLHLTRLGYTYQSKINANIDIRNNIFVDIFAESISKLNNKDYSDLEIQGIIKELSTLTDNDIDKGQAFYERLTKFNIVKLIDFENIYENDFRVVTELPFRGERNAFRPDITILINGIPLSFIEVKKPNNQEGIQKEFRRMRERFSYKDCTHFFNQMQVLGFSNNQEYNDDEKVRRVGSFYTTPNWKDTRYNLFREEEEIFVKEYIPEEVMSFVLADTNSLGISYLDEFKHNLKVDTPCNRFITSLFSIERIMFFIKYGLVFVNSQAFGFNKHIMRYPQFFATRKTVDKIDKHNMQRALHWMTQGSGKTELSYYLTNVLRDYYKKKRIVTKFYFVVDRLDLLIQATGEFSSRGMTIASINSKKDFADNIKSNVVIGSDSQHGSYKETMNVVNIQKFSEESSVELKGTSRVQRIYFVDEVHRGYKLKGEFLANLLGADPNGIYIGLTGTPILKEEFKTTDVFTDGYIYKYYYNKSIADGYTLKIKKENIATHFKEEIRGILQIKEGNKIPSAQWNVITEKQEFVDKFCEYIENDFIMFRENDNVDKSVGFMVVASTSAQAKAIHEWFNKNSDFKTALVLYDEENNKDKQEGFRGQKNKETGKFESKYDGVIVYAMLLTGFDAPRLKRLYLLREIKEHSLLQTLARVNRPYKKMQYGYVVDFVDITEQYEETNRRYLEELKGDIDDEDEDIIADIDDFFVDVEKARQTIKDITTKYLFIYMPNIETDLEDFRQQIEPLELDNLREIRTYLTVYKESYNELRMSHEDVSDIPIGRVSKALSEVNNRISIKFLEGHLDDDDDEDDIDFTQLIIEFFKTGEIDLEFDTGNDILERINNVQNAISSNGDKKDTSYFELYKEYKEIIKKIKAIKTTDEVNVVLNDLDALEKKFIILNNSNNSLIKVYQGNEAGMKIHKRIIETFDVNIVEGDLVPILIQIINVAKEEVCHLSNPSEDVIKRTLRRPIRDSFKENGYPLAPTQVENIVIMFVENMFTAED